MATNAIVRLVGSAVPAFVEYDTKELSQQIINKIEEARMYYIRHCEGPSSKV